LARAQKMLDRLDHAGVDLATAVRAAVADDDVAASLLAAVLSARAAGADAEAALRAALTRMPHS
jgi:Flp pilus assembly protein TadB